jgi:polar amino acid transport system substrate-binding protein
MQRRAFLAHLGASAALAGLAPTLPGCSPEPDANRLAIGMELGSPPFEMTDPAGKPAGVSVDLAGELARALGRTLVLENIAFDGLIASLQTGRVDLILSSMTRTEERARTVDFSEPYVETGLCLLVGKAAPVASITDLDQPGRTVAVKKGTTGHAYTASHLKQAKVLTLDHESAAVLEVIQGKVDAFIYDQISVLHLWQRNPETTRALLSPFQKEYWAIAARKGDTARLAEVNRFLARFRADGGFDRLGDRWLKSEKEACRSLGVPFVF